ncbi:ABC transporter ATP-binding protein [Termitidicoccus mucosus]
MSSQFRIIWRIMRGQRMRYGIALVCLAAATGLNYLVPLVGAAAIDHAIDHKPASGASGLVAATLDFLGGAEHLRAHLWLVIAAMVLVTAVSGVFSYLKGWLAALASDGIARRLKDELYDHLNHLPARYHDRADTGDLVQRCTSDVETARQFLAVQVMEIGNSLLLAGAALPLMLSLSAPMTLVSFALIPPLVIYSYIFFVRVRHVFKEVDESEGALTGVAQENLTGIRVVRAFARQDYERARFAVPNAAYRDASLRMIRLMAWYWSLSDLFSFAQVGLTLLVGSWWVATGGLTVGTLFAFITYLGIMLWPVRQMGRILTDLGKTTVSLGRIREILDERREQDHAAGPSATPAPAPGSSGMGVPPMPAGDKDQASSSKNPPGAAAPPAPLDPCRPPLAASARSAAAPPLPLTGRIRIRDLRYTHHGMARPALDGVSIDIEPGETLAIIGPSGSGKSTLMHLLLRLYDYDEGGIEIDGRELRAIPRKEIRARTGVVMQEPFLYARSLRENLRLGRGDAPEHEIEEAARAACIHESITNFEKGYDTLIGERGITLSGGQRQRMAIARAILKRPPILILDDALSAVDGETEALIIDALRQRRGRSTTLVIAHRLSTLAHADRVIVLDHGRVIQRGTHADLAARDGLYRRLWQIQTAIEEEFRAGAAG